MDNNTKGCKAYLVVLNEKLTDELFLDQPKSYDIFFHLQK